MHRSMFWPVAAITTVIACSTNVQAQQVPTGGDVSQVGGAFGGNAGSGNFGSGSSGSGSSGMGTNGSNGNGTVNGLDTGTAFSDVQRGNEVGATGDTGRGFSESSVAAPGGGAAVTPGGIGGGMGGFGGVGGFGRMFDNMNAGSNQSTKPIIRTRLRSAIDVPAPLPARVGQVANMRIQTIGARPELRGVNVQMQGRTAVIQGSVSNESDRRMSQLLMRLEPGVSRVDNRLIVRP